MPRPCYLVIDREHSGSISTRKLVIETAKFNVITAYSGQEAVELLNRFPNINAVVLDAGVKDIPPEILVDRLKALEPTVPIILIGSTSSSTPLQADFYLESFQPVPLLELLRKLEPEETEHIRSIEQDLDANNK